MLFNHYLAQILVTNHKTVKPEDDNDGDGQDNRTEYNAGTDGADPDSFFSVLSVTPDPADSANSQLSWKVTPATGYSIRWSDSADGPWHEVSGLHPEDVSDEGDIRTWTDRGTDGPMSGKKPGDCRARFYRVSAHRSVQIVQ